MALQQVEVEYTGKGYAHIINVLMFHKARILIFGSAHAGAVPWEGVNALDAAFLAYANISALRQQIKPTHRIHGIVTGKDWAPQSKSIAISGFRTAFS